MNLDEHMGTDKYTDLVYQEFRSDHYKKNYNYEHKDIWFEACCHYVYTIDKLNKELGSVINEKKLLELEVKELKCILELYKEQILSLTGKK